MALDDLKLGRVRDVVNREKRILLDELSVQTWAQLCATLFSFDAVRSTGETKKKDQSRVQSWERPRI